MLASKLTVATWNLGGFTSAKVVDVQRLLHDHKVDVLCIQELKWGKERTLAGFQALTCPRSSRVGGVALYIRSTLPHLPLKV